MGNIKMTMSRMQLDSKFVNNILPEWGRFITTVKLNRGLRDSNYDQLYAYLKQHEAHANENKMMMDRFTQHTMDPLALMSNVSHQQYYSQSSITPPSTYVSPHFAEGERGFEQTKECYLTEVIPFFKTLKDHFEGIRKALTKEIKEMKKKIKELEAEVDQHVVNRKHDEIERKNLLIANDNIIADCLSKEVFYIAANSELTVSRFTKMHDAHTIVQTRCLELKGGLSKLHDKI
ncbi:hypothetical protein Tco_1536685 [Tanacetum coccineum]